MTGIHQAIAGGRVLSTPGIVNITTASSAGADGYSIPMPSGVAAGRDLFIIVGYTVFGFSAGIPTNPTGMGGVNRSIGVGSQNVSLFFSGKTLTGSESGNITGDLPGSVLAYAAVAFIVENAVINTAFVTPGASTASTNTVTANAISPSWGLDATTLFITAAGRSGSSNAVSSYPANYTLAQGDISSGGNIRLSYAIRRARVTTETIGAWTFAGNDDRLLAVSAYYRGT